MAPSYPANLFQASGCWKRPPSALRTPPKAAPPAVPARPAAQPTALGFAAASANALPSAPALTALPSAPIPTRGVAPGADGSYGFLQNVWLLPLGRLYLERTHE